MSGENYIIVIHHKPTLSSAVNAAARLLVVRH